MVVRNDINQMQLISFVLNMNGNDKTLELSSKFPVSADVGENGSVINEVVKHVRENYGLNDDETLAIKFNATQEKTNVIGISSNTRLSASKIDKEAKKLRLATSGQSYFCKECNLRYRLRHNFEAHMRTHKSSGKTSEVSNKDNVRESSSALPPRSSIYNKPHADPTGSSDLERLTKHAIKSLYCEQCNKYLTSRSGLNYHMRHFHLGVKKHKCDICGRCFAMKGAMNEHRRIHTGERPFICQICGKAHRTSAILFMHLKSHSSERPHSCPICDKTFKYSHQLRRHNVVHTGEKNYVCDTCGKRFGTSRDMNRHLMTHNGLKPYECQICYSMFNQKRYLKQHLHGKHRLDIKTASTIVQNIKPHQNEETWPVMANITVNDTEETTVNENETEETSVNETQEALKVLKNVEMSETDVFNHTVFNL